MDLEVLQLQHRDWLRRNFPDQNPQHALMGVVEEVGELSHAMLKHAQGIRGYENREYFLAAAADAIGDIVIYLDGLCYELGLDFPAVVSETWKRVQQRDWNKDRVAGGESVEA